MNADRKFKIGVFDSGIGGLTVYRDIKNLLPDYDYIYLGDNGRAPYGNKSFDSVYKYTLECVNWLISQGAHLIILACNTASARALRSIQMNDWKEHIDDKRVLGVIRPTVEYIYALTQTKHIGVVATDGTVRSMTYPIEFNHLDSQIVVTQKPCPLWVPLIESNQINSITEKIFRDDLKELFSKDTKIDSLLLGCTHYPHAYDVIRKYTPEHIEVYSQGRIVAESLSAYLTKHHWIESQLSKNCTETFYTTDDVASFKLLSSSFLDREIEVKHIDLEALTRI